MRSSVLLTIFISFITACSTVKEVPAVKKGDFKQSDIPADSITAQIPDYSSSLATVKGKGKAIVSEPENSQRITLYFSSNSQKSLITVKNSIGIEGGKLLTDGDSLLIYNRVDKYARIIPVKNNDFESINNLASLNVLEILTFPVRVDQVDGVFENDNLFMLMLTSGIQVYVNKKTFLVRQINQPGTSGLPYSSILYDGYETVNDLKMPRRVTIFSTDRSSKVDLLVQSLEINPDLGELEIDLPDDIKIYRQ